MKKITLLAAVAMAFSFASCKKARTCTCTGTSSYTETHTDGTPAYTSPAYTGAADAFVTSTKLTKAQGKGLCASGKEVTTDVETGPTDTQTTVYTYEKTCTLK